MPPPLYFMAILPPPPIRAEVTAFKQQARKRFHSAHALTSPPHITLTPPFRYEPARIPGLVDEASDWLESNLVPFDIQLDDFDAFPPRVIFVKIGESPPLIALQKQWSAFLDDTFGIPREERPFHPHMTVAFKDLHRPEFPRAWAYFKNMNYQRGFTVEGVALLKHEGGKWEVESEMP
jgi:2'-5' RNA ligase